MYLLNVYFYSARMHSIDKRKIFIMSKMFFSVLVFETLYSLYNPVKMCGFHKNIKQHNCSKSTY